MRNRRALAAVVSSSLLLCCAVIACSSDDEKSTFTTDQPDGSFDSGPGFFTDANQQQTADGPLVCEPQLPASFLPKWTPPVPSDACQAADIESYYTTCLANDSTGTPQFNGKTCTDWLAAHGDCAKCIEKDDNSSPIQSYRNRLYYTLNNAGCIAIEQGNNADSSCGAKYDAATQCRRASCDSCFDQAGSQFSDFTACQAAADDSGACSTYNGQSNTACVGYKSTTSDAGVPQCFPLTGDAGSETSSSKSFYLRVIGYFCAASH